MDRGVPPSFLASLAVAMCARHSEARGVGGPLTFGWLAVSRGQEL